MKKTLYSDENRLLSLLLREARINAGLSQDALNAKLERHRTFVSKYETLERRVDVVELKNICAVLDYDFLEFVKYFVEECEALPHSLIRDKALRERL